MIFYFSGTGNSLFAAKTLAHDGEEVISMIDAVRSKAFRCTLKENEPLGFVFPVYFYTVSDPVLELVRNLTVENASFVYAVIPCRSSMVAGADFCARKIGSFIMGLIMTSYPSWQSGRSRAQDRPAFLSVRSLICRNRRYPILPHPGKLRQYFITGQDRTAFKAEKT